MKLNSRTGGRGIVPAIVASLALPAALPVLAQGEEAIEEVVVVGSRRQDRSAADSPVPVDVVDGDAFRNLGDTDMDSLIAALVPSYNVDQQPISDAATVIRPASLRGLSSDATLVLVNGKRRHRASVISFLGGGINDGAQGPDLSIIPAIALYRLEVLRDGASAQYGSDAIAGVMNFVLRDDASGGTVEAKFGRHYEGDGDTLTIAANVGMPLMDEGFLNVSGEFKQADPTTRSVQRADAQGLIDAGNNAVRQPAAQIWGAPEIRGDYKLFANLGVPTGAGELYAFGNYAQRTVEGGFFFRNPHTRGGVFRGPVFDAAGPAAGNVVTYDNGAEVWRYADDSVYAGARVETVLVADISASPATRTDAYGGTVYSGCPAITVVDNVAVGVDAVAAAANCFSFIQRFPGGFTPQFGGDVLDYSIAVGLRGELASGWLYDVSGVIGHNETAFFMHNTINPQLVDRQMNIPTSYKPGTYLETDRVFDLNLSKPLEMDGLASPLYLALGFEYRDETFEIQAGGENSWLVDDRFAAQGFGIASNGFPGFQPDYEVDATRGSFAGYVDVEANVSARMLLGGAVRYENYDDFGATLDGKLTMRWELADNFALRGAASTGFRAPTVGQANVRNVSTVFTNNMLADRGTLPPTHPVSVRLGGKPLEPEESVNLTIGATFSMGMADVTVDYYNIAVEGRIAQTSPILLTEEDRAALRDVPEASSLTTITWFTNDFDTTTKGVDLVVTAPLDFGPGETTLTFVANRNDTDVDNRNPDIISDQRVTQLKRALPRNKLSATLNHVVGDWRMLGRFRRYGEFTGYPADVGGWRRDYEPRYFVDVEAAYTMNDTFTVVVGAQNLLDEYPQETVRGAQDGVGMLYPENSPYGFGGGFYYFRAVWDFN